MFIHEANEVDLLDSNLYPMFVDTVHEMRNE